MEKLLLWGPWMILDRGEGADVADAVAVCWCCFCSSLCV